MSDAIPRLQSIDELPAALGACRNCELWAPATQAVPGEGRPRAEVMLVGEQPGDREDRDGRPFVGPAGRLLDEALERAGIDRGSAYVTNAVKHFRFQERGKRRIHQKPDRSHVVACQPWLLAELELVKPRALVLLGATATSSLLGTQARVMRDRGKLLDSDLAELVSVTIHPSALLRLPDPADREAETERFVQDLAAVAAAL